MKRLDPLKVTQRSRVPWVFLEYGRLRASENHLVLERETGDIELPASMFSVILAGPGLTVTHEAIKMCAENAVRFIWVGEGMTRLYAASAQSEDPSRLLIQANIHQNLKLRLEAAQRLYKLMFDQAMPPSFTIEKLRGLEGSRVKEVYRDIAQRHGFDWQGRESAPPGLQSAIGFATSCLYAISEAAIHTLGYSPAIGIVHSGDPRSFVFDVADTLKFKTVIPIAFAVYKENHSATIAALNQKIRHACRDHFLQDRVFETLLDNINAVLNTQSDKWS